MNLKINYLFCLLVLLAVGCSTAKKESKSEDTSEKSLTYDESNEEDKTEGLNTEQVKSSPKELETKYKKLAEALNSKSEKNILDASSLILFEDPDDVKTLNGLALFYLSKGKVGLAKQYIARALKKGAGEAAIQNNVGVIYAADGDQESAIAAYKKSLSIDSGNVQAATNLGVIYAKYGAYEKALPLLERAYDKNKSNNVATAYAVSLRGTKKYSEAQKIYKGLVSTTDDVAMLLDYAELLVNELKSESEARTVLNKIRFLDPKGEIVDRVIQLERQLK